jgi:hypothetical protein
MDSELLRRHVAVHESGHATIGRVLNLTCGVVTIVPDEALIGHCQIGDERSILDEWR